MAQKLIIDTDPGVDDALAIFMAFNSSEVCRRRGKHRARTRASEPTQRVCSCAGAVTRVLRSRCARAAALERVADRRVAARGCATQVEVLGLTTIFGNVTTALATANALHLCEMAGRPDVRVAQACGGARRARTRVPRAADSARG
jgi:hypothetical protein